MGPLLIGVALSRGHRRRNAFDVDSWHGTAALGPTHSRQLPGGNRSRDRSSAASPPTPAASEESQNQYVSQTDLIAESSVPTSRSLGWETGMEAIIDIALVILVTVAVVAFASLLMGE